MATIGRSAAVAVMGKVKLSGYPAWLAWLFVHLIFLVGFRNRTAVLFQWAYSYFSNRRSARIITHQPQEPPDKGPPPDGGFTSHPSSRRRRLQTRGAFHHGRCGSIAKFPPRCRSPWPDRKTASDGGSTGREKWAGLIHVAADRDDGVHLLFKNSFKCFER